MKRFLLSNQELISFYLLIAFLISLPVKENFNSLSMILLSVFAFLLILFKQKINSSLLKKFIPLFVFYGVLLISVLYSSDTANAMKMVSRWLPFILLPFVFSIIKLPAKRYHQLMKLFVYWMAILCVYSHVVILIKLYNNNDVLYNIFNSHYSYLSLSKGTIGLHSTYYAYFIIVAVVFLVNFLFTEKRRSMQILSFILIGYFSFFVFHLSARLPIAVLFVLYNLALLYYFTKQKQILKGVLFLVLLYFISSLVIYNVRITRYRFQHLFGFTYSDGTHHEDGRDKILQWKSALAGNNNAFFGNGAGDANESIFDSYEAHDLDKYSEREYNAHNQFIQTYVGMGLVGVAVLLFIFFFYFKAFYKEASFVGYSLILLTFILYQTESYLERHNGVVMFVFLICFLMKKQETTSIE